MNGTIFDTYDKNIDTSKLGLVRNSKGDKSHIIFPNKKLKINENTLEERFDNTTPLEINESKRTHRESARFN